MKKLLFIAAVAAVAMTACSKDAVLENTTSDNAVVFGTYVNTTKAGAEGIMNLAALQTNGFGVFSYYTNNADYAQTATPNFMYNTKVSTAAWTYAPIKYWPNQYGTGANSTAVDKLTFFAYAPYVEVAPATGAVTGSAKEGITAISTNAAAGDPTVSFTVPEKVENMVDLLYANQDATTGSNTQNMTKQSVTGKVTFKFAHALSNVSYKVQAVVDATAPTTSALDANTTITLDSVIFEGATTAKKGVLNLRTGVWTVAETENASFKLGGLNQVVTETAAPINGVNSSVMTIPAAATNYTVRVVYKVKTIDANLVAGYSEITNTITKTANIALAQGKKNTITLILGMTSVKMTATVSDWNVTGAADSTIDLPANN